MLYLTPKTGIFGLAPYHNPALSAEDETADFGKCNILRQRTQTRWSGPWRANRSVTGLFWTMKELKRFWSEKSSKAWITVC